MLGSKYSKHTLHAIQSDAKMILCNLKNSSLPFDAHCWSWASECPDVKNYKRRLNPVWHRMLYSCTHMATVGVKG